MTAARAARSVGGRVVHRLGRTARASAAEALKTALRHVDGAAVSEAPPEPSPFFHYNASFDAESVMKRHACDDPSPHAGYVTNFLGVRIDPKFFPQILDGRAGTVEPIPIPANWHADIAEWAAALRAVDLAGDRFTMAELGCGWGCWMNNTGVAAKRSGRGVHVIGVEADEGHLAFAREACATNGFEAEEVTLHRGVAGASSGTALFPRQDVPGEEWGLEPVFHPTGDERAAALASGKYDELPVVGLPEIVGDHPRLDLLHVDIQGSEADLIERSRALLAERVAYLVVGTHSRQIEGRLFTCLLDDGWRLEIERPAILALPAGEPVVTVDGVQGWRNAALASE